MAEQEDTSREYVSRASSFTYCGRESVVGIQVPVTTDAIKEYPAYPVIVEHWFSKLICQRWSEDCARVNGFLW